MQLTVLRQFFPPGFDKPDEEVGADETTGSKNSETPDLPDVPSQEPSDAGEPDAKKRKTSGGDDTAEVTKAKED